MFAPIALPAMLRIAMQAGQLVNILFAPIAQLVEQLPLKQTVVGSNPTGRTICPRSSMDRTPAF